jgi:hypothetical protein
MFPNVCGEQLEALVAHGADPQTVVPNDFYLVKGGIGPLLMDKPRFSAVVGPTLEAAATAVPHGSLRATTVGEVRRLGGIVEWVPEYSACGTMNKQHVNVSVEGLQALSEPIPNPVPRAERIDGERK